MRDRAAGRGTTGRGVAWALLVTLVAAAALWFLLHGAGYGTIYRRLASALNAYRSPAWLAVVLAAGAAVLTFLSLTVRRAGRRGVRRAPDVHLRVESEDHITVMISGVGGAAAADYVVPRNPSAERRIAERFRGLGKRAATFGAAAPEDASAELRELGRALGDRVLGGRSGAAGALAELDGDHLQLSVQSELAQLPWEHLVPRGEGLPLWRLYHVARQLRSPGGTTPAPTRPRRPLRVLLIAIGDDGSGRPVPEAEREAEAIMEVAARRPDALRVTRRTPQSGEELATLLYGRYDVLHFAGHATHTVDGRGWVLPGGDRFLAQDLRSADAPALVFANACSTAAADSDGDLEAAAMRFMEWGAAAYLGSLWDVDDRGAADFASAFYRSIAAGATLAGAVTAAREALLPGGILCAAAYVLYGDPTLVLAAEPDDAKKRTA